jgi:hypothetical protein
MKTHVYYCFLKTEKICVSEAKCAHENMADWHTSLKHFNIYCLENNYARMFCYWSLTTTLVAIQMKKLINVSHFYPVCSEEKFKLIWSQRVVDVVQKYKCNPLLKNNYDTSFETMNTCISYGAVVK